MLRLIAPFRKLGWKLTFSYTLVTVLTLIVAEAIALCGLVIAAQFFLPYLIDQLFMPALETAVRPFLEEDPPDISGLNQMIWAQYQPPATLDLDDNTTIDLSPYSSGSLMVYILATDGATLSVNRQPEESGPVGQPWESVVSMPGLEPLVENALAGNRNQSPFYIQTAEGVFYFVQPILTAAGDRLLGVLIVGAESSSGWSQFQDLLTLLGSSLLCFTCGAGVVGTVFGFFTARGLTRRLARLQLASDSWSQGNFEVRAEDKSGDEIGQLARRLNQMAEQLRTHMQTRQELATIEERNRLARDLHDSVKQQIFATAMQLGAARELLERDPQVARQHLLEAEELARNARDELTTLIRELRPAALEGKGLPQALRDYVEDWSRQTAIPADLRTQGERSAPLEVEQAFLRVAQEALANVARHSKAERVEVDLRYEGELVALTIADNGLGFDPASIKKGVGLDSMRERLDSLGGQLGIESRPGQGTRVTATIGRKGAS